MEPRRRILLLKAAVWLLGLYPLGRVAWWLRDGLLGLGANPIERVLHHTGWWALTLLLVTLAVTPLRRITGRNELVKLRRPLGLFAFFYATLHLAIYLGLDQVFGWSYILEDIAERPFITVGFLGWVLLLPLALTSTRGWIRRLGRRWTILHRAAYIATACGVIHFYWRVKADTRVPLLFAAVLVALLLLRMRWTRRTGTRAPRRAVPIGARE
ncbi:MAG TPA: protein-methionine-sulfoxide reductase heme-binding subunit MsrQ [Longimicrobiales bacterium]|nr:protein-methionine-sulfoxide reductase heme-binding subunit MsrQ [Longimicrobiales bacterium]